MAELSALVRELVEAPNSIFLSTPAKPCILVAPLLKSHTFQAFKPAVHRKVLTSLLVTK